MLIIHYYNYFLGDSRFSAVITERERRRTNPFIRKVFSVELGRKAMK
ncbi:hypothetical protein B0I26_101228 [Anoxybacillus vitaminiphilus]|uniref:Uncharacterized protein n=1 Tax=Paranoxybacillus vitaminiphilus TaxID=581036 RepID=A0A327YRU0_9BACL|nr:hypothetical protein [Anoxybacillus vitaminiphilus]RAK23272.1 hypothetical protein B0I26_101228 [Anoxybacillus vitaminiphilus]